MEVTQTGTFIRSLDFSEMNGNFQIEPTGISFGQMLNVQGSREAGMAPPTNVARVRIPVPAQQHFQILIRSGKCPQLVLAC